MAKEISLGLPRPIGRGLRLKFGQLMPVFRGLVRFFTWCFRYINSGGYTTKHFILLPGTDLLSFCSKPAGDRQVRRAGKDG